MATVTATVMPTRTRAPKARGSDAATVPLSACMAVAGGGLGRVGADLFGALYVPGVAAVSAATDIRPAGSGSDGGEQGGRGAWLGDHAQHRCGPDADR